MRRLSLLIVLLVATLGAGVCQKASADHDTRNGWGKSIIPQSISALWTRSKQSGGIAINLLSE